MPLVFVAVIRNTARQAREPWRLVLKAFFWGAVFSVIIAIIFSLVLSATPRILRYGEPFLWDRKVVRKRPHGFPCGDFDPIVLLLSAPRELDRGFRIRSREDLARASRLGLRPLLPDRRDHACGLQPRCGPRRVVRDSIWGFGKAGQLRGRGFLRGRGDHACTNQAALSDAPGCKG